MKLLALALIVSAALFAIRTGVAAHDVGAKIQSARTALIEQAAQ